MALLRRNSCYGAMEWIFKILCLFGMLWNPTGSASSSLLGMGGGSGGLPKGVSFNVDTMDKRMSRIHGNGLKLDLDMIEIDTAGGKLKYTPTHLEFETGSMHWITAFSPVKATFTYNEKPVFQLYVPDDTPFYFLSMSQTNLGVHDIIMDKTLTIGLLKQLHGAEHVLNSISTAMETQTTGDSEIIWGETERLMESVAEDYRQNGLRSDLQSIQQLLQYSQRLLLQLSRITHKSWTLLRGQLGQRVDRLSDELTNISTEWYNTTAARWLQFETETRENSTLLALAWEERVQNLSSTWEQALSTGIQHSETENKEFCISQITENINVVKKNMTEMWETMLVPLHGRVEAFIEAQNDTWNAWNNQWLRLWNETNENNQLYTQNRVTEILKSNFDLNNSLVIRIDGVAKMLQEHVKAINSSQQNSQAMWNERFQSSNEFWNNSLSKFSVEQNEQHLQRQNELARLNTHWNQTWNHTKEEWRGTHERTRVATEQKINDTQHMCNETIIKARNESLEELKQLRGEVALWQQTWSRDNGSQWEEWMRANSSAWKTQELLNQQWVQRTGSLNATVFEHHAYHAERSESMFLKLQQELNRSMTLWTTNHHLLNDSVNEQLSRQLANTTQSIDFWRRNVSLALDLHNQSVTGEFRRVWSQSNASWSDMQRMNVTLLTHLERVQNNVSSKMTAIQDQMLQDLTTMHLLVTAVNYTLMDQRVLPLEAYVKRVDEERQRGDSALNATWLDWTDRWSRNQTAFAESVGRWNQSVGAWQLSMNQTVRQWNQSWNEAWTVHTQSHALAEQQWNASLLATRTHCALHTNHTAKELREEWRAWNVSMQLMHNTLQREKLSVSNTTWDALLSNVSSLSRAVGSFREDLWRQWWTQNLTDVTNRFQTECLIPLRSQETALKAVNSSVAFSIDEYHRSRVQSLVEPWTRRVADHGTLIERLEHSWNSTQMTVKNIEQRLENEFRSVNETITAQRLLGNLTSAHVQQLETWLYSWVQPSIQQMQGQLVDQERRVALDAAERNHTSMSVIDCRTRTQALEDHWQRWRLTEQQWNQSFTAHQDSVKSHQQSTAVWMQQMHERVMNMSQAQETSHYRFASLTSHVQELMGRMEHVVNNSLRDTSLSLTALKSAVADQERSQALLHSNMSQLEKTVHVQEQWMGYTRGHVEQLLFTNASTAVRLVTLEKQVEGLEQRSATQSNAIAAMQERLTALDARVQAQEKRLAALEESFERSRKESASQDSVDSLRKLLYDIQTHMLTHSNKVLDVIVSQAEISVAKAKGSSP